MLLNTDVKDRNLWRQLSHADGQSPKAEKANDDDDIAPVRTVNE